MQYNTLHTRHTKFNQIYLKKRKNCKIKISDASKNIYPFFKNSYKTILLSIQPQKSKRHTCLLIIHILKILHLYKPRLVRPIIGFLQLTPCADPEGGRGQGVWTPPGKSQLWGSSGSPGKPQSYQASILCWANIGRSKWCFAGRPMMACF